MRRIGRWTCPEPGKWVLDHSELHLDWDRQHGWCLWGSVEGIYPAGDISAWSLKIAMRDAERFNNDALNHPTESADSA